MELPRFIAAIMYPVYALQDLQGTEDCSLFVHTTRQCHMNHMIRLTKPGGFEMRFILISAQRLEREAGSGILMN